MSRRLVDGGEDTGRLDNVVGTGGTPWDGRWVTFTEDGDGLAVDDEFAIFSGDGSLESTMGGVVLEHVDHVVEVNERADGVRRDVIHQWGLVFCINGLTDARQFPTHSLMATTSISPWMTAFLKTIRPIRPVEKVKENSAMSVQRVSEENARVGAVSRMRENVGWRGRLGCSDEVMRSGRRVEAKQRREEGDRGR